MAEKRTDELLAHEYDGIREYDNPTPGWWHWLFLLSVLFSVFYGFFWHFSPLAWTEQQAHAAAEVRELTRQFAALGALDADEPTMLRMMSDPKWMSVGESIYRGNCASCHGSRAEGLVGPNLTDDYYKHVKQMPDLLTVVQNGAATGAMPAWKGRLHDNEIVLVSSYIAGLRGRNLPGRPPEGEAAPPWPRPAEADGQAGSN